MGVAHAPLRYAPVIDDSRLLGRHTPPPVGVLCKSHRRGGLQTPAPRYRCHTPTARPRDAVLARGEHSVERAFPPAFPLLNPLRGADYVGAMLLCVGDDMAVAHAEAASLDCTRTVAQTAVARGVYGRDETRTSRIAGPASQFPAAQTAAGRSARTAALCPRKCNRTGQQTSPP